MDDVPWKLPQLFYFTLAGKNRVSRSELNDSICEKKSSNLKSKQTFKFGRFKKTRQMAEFNNFLWF
jgi:hypothetical protein